MTRVEFSHLRELSTTGQYVDFAIFQATPNDDTPNGRDEVLFQLIQDARRMGLRVDSGAIAYEKNGEIKTWGDDFARDYLSKRGIPPATHYLNY